jgi:hypothetical protein
MTGSAPAQPDDEPTCAGIRIVRLEFDPANSLIVVLTERLGCPTCGTAGDRWVIPVFQDRIFHRPGGRPDPGE